MYIEGGKLSLPYFEELFDTKCMRAVEQATMTVGDGLVNESDRKTLQEAILSSCINGRNFHFAYWPLPMGKDNFYEQRRKFLYKIAIYMGFI